MATSYVHICRKEQHQHTSACQTPGKRKGEMRVTCGKQEHACSIGGGCYKAVEQDKRKK